MSREPRENDSQISILYVPTMGDKIKKKLLLKNAIQNYPIFPMNY